MDDVQLEQQLCFLSAMIVFDFFVVVSENAFDLEGMQNEVEGTDKEIFKYRG